MTTWESLVASAVQGTARRAVQPSELMDDLGLDAVGLGGNPAELLLDAAALATVARRAGAQLVMGPPVRDPVPIDPRAVIPSEVFGLDVSRQTYAEILRLARRHNLRLPGGSLVDLMHAGVRFPEIARDLMAAAGPIGLRLARLNPEWNSLLGAVEPRAVALQSVGHDGEPGSVWSTGTAQQRLDWLAALRQVDPQQAGALCRDVLRGACEPPDFRVRMIALLADESPACELEDEALEAALDARSRDVRRAARAVLAGRPGSSFVERMRRRAERWVHLAPAGAGLAWSLTWPAEFDQSERRDGLAEHPPALLRAFGERGAALYRVLESTPLAHWEQYPYAQVLAASAAGGTAERLIDRPLAALLRANRDVDRVIDQPPGPGPALDSSGHLTYVIHQALLDRVVMESNRGWAHAFVAHQPWPPALIEQLPGIAGLLSPAAAHEATRILLDTAGPQQGDLVDAWLKALNFPITDELCAALIAQCARWAATRRTQPLVRTAAERLAREQPPLLAGALHEAAVRVATRTGSRVAAQALEDAANLHRLRARIHGLVARAAEPNHTAQPSNPAKGDRP